MIITYMQTNAYCNTGYYYNFAVCSNTPVTYKTTSIKFLIKTLHVDLHCRSKTTFLQTYDSVCICRAEVFRCVYVHVYLVSRVVREPPLQVSSVETRGETAVLQGSQLHRHPLFGADDIIEGETQRCVVLVSSLMLRSVHNRQITCREITLDCGFISLMSRLRGFLFVLNVLKLACC